MSRVILLLGVLTVLAAGSGADRPAVTAVAGGLAAAEPETVDDPFPIRRVFLPADRLAARVAAAGDDGPFVRLPRTTFEAKVREASRAKSAAPPRLVIAHYSATFAENVLNGSGRWHLSYPSARALPLVLDPLRVALSHMQWENGTPAVIFRPDAGPAELWADPAEGSALRFSWSARAVEEPGERRYDLRLPLAAVATLELTVPASHTVAVPRSDALLTGPFPGPSATQRLWRITFGGQPRLELSIRTEQEPGRPPPLARVHLDATCDMTPGVVDLAYAFEFDPLRGPVTEWAFRVDPRLKIVGVAIPGGGTWFDTPAPDPTRPGRLTVRPIDPDAAVRLTVRATAPPIPPATGWAFPTVRPEKTLPGDETVLVRLHPALTLARVEAGDFRVADTAVATDLSHAVSFAGSLLRGESRTTRDVPVLYARPTATNIRSTGTVVWSVRPGNTVLTASISATVLRGPVDELTFRLPNGFSPLPPKVTPDDPTAEWTPTDRETNTWRWTPSSPLAGGKAYLLDLTLLGPSAIPGRPIPFPSLILPGTGPHVGTFFVESRGDVQVDTSPPVAGEGISYRGDLPGGVLTVRPRVGNEIPSPAAPPQIRPDVAPSPDAVTLSDGTVYWFTSAALRLDGPVNVQTYSGYFVPGRGSDFRLPVHRSADVVSLRVADRWVDAPLRPDPESLSVPVPAGGTRAVPFECTFRSSTPGPFGSTSPAVPIPPDLPVSLGTGSEYRILPDLSERTTGPATRRVVRTTWVTAAGLTAGLVTLGVGSRIRRPRARLVATFIAVLAFGGLLILLPDGWLRVFVPPFAVAALSALAHLVRSSTRGRAFGIVASITVVLPATAQAPEPSTVFLTRDDNGDLSVHAPQPLIDRLDQLAAGPRAGVVVTSANYSAVESESGVTVVARYTVYAFRPSSPALVLPLHNVRLTGMTLDGRPAFPATKPEGFALTVPTPGRHDVEVTFTAGPSRPGPDRVVQFGVPDVPQSRLAFTVLPTSRQPSAPSRRGHQSVIPGPNGSILTAELGGGKTVTLRWRAGPRDPRPGVSVRELAVWDITPTDLTLTASYLVRTDQGGVNQLALEVPGGLEPGRPTVRTFDADGTVSSTVGVRDWTLGPEVNGQRLLTLFFATPIESQAAVTLRFLSTTSPNTRPALRMPRVVRVADVESFGAIRTQGVTATSRNAVNGVEAPSDVLDRTFHAIPELQLDQKPPITLFRSTGQQFHLVPVLRQTDAILLSQTWTWTVGPRADVSGTVKWSTTGDAPSAVPFDLPLEVRPVDLTGIDVWTRSLTGVRGEVWLKRPTKSGALTWTGSYPVRPGGVRLPCPPLSCGTVRVVVQAVPGWVVSVPPAWGVTAEPLGDGRFAVTSGPGVRFVWVDVASAGR